MRYTVHVHCSWRALQRTESDGELSEELVNRKWAYFIPRYHIFADYALLLVTVLTICRNLYPLFVAVLIYWRRGIY